jgi:hypothetical protein
VVLLPSGPPFKKQRVPSSEHGLVGPVADVSVHKQKGTIAQPRRALSVSFLSSSPLNFPTVGVSYHTPVSVHAVLFRRFLLKKDSI